MSKWECVKCGHDTDGEGGNPWFGAEGGRICKTCCETLVRKFYALLGLEGPGWDEYGPDIHWHQVVAILDGPHERDIAMRRTYYMFELSDLARREAEIHA